MRISRSKNTILFLAVFCLAGLAGLYINIKMKFIFGDALVRSFHAYSVIFGYQPKLSSIGFVWPPLQTILELPLVLIKPLNIHGLAGNILSAFFLGLTAVYLNLLATFLKVHKTIKYTFIFLFITNPLIFFYGSNGMSEIIGICFILMTIYYFLRHLATKSLTSLIFSSLSLACAIMTRWEAGILLFLIMFLIIIIPLVRKKYSRHEAESSLVAFSVPVFFVISIWLLVSWLIIGSPLYFIHGPTLSYAMNQEQLTAYNTLTLQASNQLASHSELHAAKGNITSAIMYILKRIVAIAPMFIPLLLLTLTKIVGKSRIQVLTICGFVLSLILPHILLIYSGTSYGELRYFIFVIPFTFIFLLFLFKNTLAVSYRNYFYIILFFLSALSILVSSVSAVYAMSSVNLNNQENIFMRTLLNNNNQSINYDYEKEVKIADYITANIHSRGILVDDSVGFPIIYFTQKSYLFIESMDSDYEQTIADPFKNANYILISNPNNSSGIDRLNIVYPNMFNKGRHFLTLQKDFGNWKLYKIVKN